MCIMNICYNATSTARNANIMRSLISHENLKFHLQFTSTVTYDSKVTEKGKFLVCEVRTGENHKENGE